MASDKSQTDHPQRLGFPSHHGRAFPPSQVLQHPQFRAGLARSHRAGCYSRRPSSAKNCPILQALPMCFLTRQSCSNRPGMVMRLDAHDHAAKATLFRSWFEGMRDLAKRPNVTCKISGFGMPFWDFGFDTRTVGPDTWNLPRRGGRSSKAPSRLSASSVACFPATFPRTRARAGSCRCGTR